MYKKINAQKSNSDFRGIAHDLLLNFEVLELDSSGIVRCLSISHMRIDSLFCVVCTGPS